MKKLLSCLFLIVLSLSLLVSCTNDKDDEDKEKDVISQELADAKSYLHAMYKNSATVTPADITRVSVVSISNVNYTVTWTVNVTTGASTAVKVVAGAKAGDPVTIDVDEHTTEEVKYTLTATISDAAGIKVTQAYEYSVPVFKELTWAEYIAKEAEQAVVIKGVVTAIAAKSRGNSYNCIYLQDNDGGYYVYGMATDPITDDKVAIGMTIRVTGAKDIYSGTHEIKDATVEILKSEITTVTPIDWTAKYTAATSAKDAALVEKQAMLVTVKGVTLTDQNLSSGYYNFKLGTLSSYVRISSSVCPLTKSEQTEFKTKHISNRVADVTGVICVYDGAFYLTPVSVDAIVLGALPELSEEEEIAFEKETLALSQTEFTNDGSIDLVMEGVSYSDVKVTYASSDECAVVDNAKGTLTVTLPEEEKTVTITATLTSGTKTDTATFEITVDAASTTNYVAKVVTTPVADKAFKFVVEQNNLGKTLYVDGGLSGKYLTTTDKAEKAADVFVEVVEGGYKLYTKVEDAKKYIEIFIGTDSKTAIRLADTGTVVYTFNTEYNTFTTTIGEDTYYIGTYNKFDTFSASKISYAATSFVGHICTRDFAE